MKYSRLKLFKRLYSYFYQYSYLLVISLIFSIFVVGLTLYFPILVGKGVDILGAKEISFTALINLLVYGFVLVVITSCLQWLVNVCNNRLAYLLAGKLRILLFEKIERLPLEYLDGHGQGDLLSRVVSDVDVFGEGLLLALTQLFTGLLTIGGTLYFMFNLNFIISFAVVVVTPLSLIVASFISRTSFQLFRQQVNLKGEQTSYIQEMINNEKVVQAYNHTDQTISDFFKLNKRLQKISVKAIFYSSTVQPATRFVNNIVYAIVGIVGALLVFNNVLTVGILATFLTYANQYTKPFNEITGVFTEFQNSLACLNRIFEVLDEKEIVETGSKSLESVRGKIEFRNVGFSYDKDKEFIKNFNFIAYPGQRIAIVGPTGCGKTTIINLLMRFYNYQEGSILIDDQPITNLSYQNLRNNCGMVLQDTWLKSGTIKENILISNPQATNEEIIQAAKSSYAHNFIKRLPKGYDTYISEEYGLLSQGQKQLLCITRLMLSLPPILILDEATSSIDVITESRVQKAFDKLMVGRTCLIVAHRLSTIKEADLILVMDQGKIIEQGNHQDLLDKKGFYYQLYNSQFSG